MNKFYIIINIMQTCNLCKYSSLDKSNFSKHCKSKQHLTNEEIKKYCLLCDKKFINLQTYRQHKKNIHNKIKNKNQGSYQQCFIPSKTF